MFIVNIKIVSPGYSTSPFATLLSSRVNFLHR